MRTRFCHSKPPARTREPDIFLTCFGGSRRLASTGCKKIGPGTRELVKTFNSLKGLTRRSPFYRPGPASATKLLRDGHETFLSTDGPCMMRHTLP